MNTSSTSQSITYGVTAGNKEGGRYDLFSGNRAIWMVVFLLLSFSTVVIFSATSTTAFEAEGKGANFFGIFGRHLLHISMAVATIFLVSKLPSKYLRRGAWAFYIVSMIGVLLVPIIGEEINGARRSIRILFISIQPYEFARLALINLVAYFLRVSRGEHSSPKVFWKIAAVTLVTTFAIFFNNISTSILLFAVIYIMCIMGGVNKRLMIRSTLIMVVGAVALFALFFAFPNVAEKVGRSSTGVNRIVRFVQQSHAPINRETYDEPDGIDTQVVMSQNAIANSKLIGVGPGYSQFREFLPEAYSDFVFSILWEELGIIGASLVIFIYLMLFLAAGGIARRSRSVYKSMLVQGIALIILMQAVLHMMICTNAFPITGQNLPFISRGGSSMLATACYFGIMLAISKEVTQGQRAGRENLAQEVGVVDTEPQLVPEIEVDDDEE